jgi:acetolactate synthase-1/2/3 large subunit
MDAVSDPDVDTVVAIGTNLGEWATGGWNRAVLLNDRLVHVESDAGNFTRSPMARLHVRGRILTIFEHMLDYMRLARPDMDVESLVDTWTRTLTPQGRARGESSLHFHLDDEAKYLDDSTPIKPQRLMRELTELFPPNSLFLADTGNSMAWAIHYLHPFDRRISGKRDSDDGLFRTCLEFASMGWAIGAAVGTALGGCTGPVVCITGDGSVLMSGQEITVAVQEKLPIIFVILNDGGLGMVKHGQRLAKAEPIGYDIPPVNFAARAGAMGAQGFQVFSPRDLSNLDIDSICKRHGPTVLDVHIDPDEVPPMGTRIRALNSNL